MADRFAPGDRVRTRIVDPPGHTRLPRYARGARGEIVEPAGAHPLADDRARGLDVSTQPVYHVRFPAAQLFGAGEHDVVVELWESYLEPVDDPQAHDPRADNPQTDNPQADNPSTGGTGIERGIAR